MSASKHFAEAAGKYRVTVKAGDWHGYSTARFHTCMGEKSQSGDKFYSQAEWAALRYNKVHVLVPDTLIRFNIMSQTGVDEDTARKQAREIGDKWIAENQKALSRLPGCEISRWDDWLKHPSFEDSYQKVKTCYETNTKFRAMVDELAENFIDNHRTDLTDAQRAAHKENSRLYLLEELAVDPIMIEHERAVEIRQGRRSLRLLEAMRDGVIPDAPEGYKHLKTAVVGFRRRKSKAEAQVFQEPRAEVRTYNTGQSPILSTAI